MTSIAPCCGTLNGRSHPCAIRRAGSYVYVFVVCCSIFLPNNPNQMPIDRTCFPSSGHCQENDILPLHVTNAHVHTSSMRTLVSSLQRQHSLPCIPIPARSGLMAYDCPTGNGSLRTVQAFGDEQIIIFCYRIKTPSSVTGGTHTHTSLMVQLHLNITSTAPSAPVCLRGLRQRFSYVMR